MGLHGWFSVVLGGWLREVDFICFRTLAAGRQMVYLVGITCMLLMSLLVWWCVAGDLPVARSLGGGVDPLLFDGVDGNDAV